MISAAALAAYLLGLGLAFGVRSLVQADRTSNAGVELQVRRVEEPYLHQSHGPPYRDYTARVGRSLPGIGRTGT